MSNIDYRMNATIALLMDYKKILLSKITDVCHKIGFDDYEIRWHIFDPKEGKNNMEKIFIGRYGKDYGYCKISSKEIWISTYAIQKEKPAEIKKIESVLKCETKQDDFLAAVIIDEITHIQTGRDHGDKEYDEKLHDNLEKYYGRSPYL